MYLYPVVLIAVCMCVFLYKCFVITMPVVVLVVALVNDMSASYGVLELAAELISVGLNVIWLIARPK